MVTTKTNKHADPLLGSRWAQMWAYMWAEQLVIFWYMLPKVTYNRWTIVPSKRKISKRYVLEGDNTYETTVVPRALTAQILRMAHDE